jgi:hypothetical protein
MQRAIDNLNGRELLNISFDQRHMITEFAFAGNLRLVCLPYEDPAPNEEFWMLFAPTKQVASFVPHGLRYEHAQLNEEKTASPR